MTPLRTALIRYLNQRLELGDSKVYLPRGLPEPVNKLLPKEAKHCSKCQRSKRRIKVVWGHGAIPANLMVVGDIPEPEDESLVRPFQDKNGKMLSRILTAMHIPFSDVYFTLALKCSTKKEHTSEQIYSCQAWLFFEIEKVKPKYILAFGEVPAKSLLQTDATLGSLRAMNHSYNGIPVQVTYSLNTLIKTPRLKKATWNDLQKVIIWYKNLS